MIQEGKIDVGYSIEDTNKSVKYCKRLERVECIGDYYVLFDRTSNYYFKANTVVKAFGINKDLFNQALEKYPHLYDKLRMRAFRKHFEYLHHPMQKEIKIDIKNFNSMNRELEINQNNIADVHF